MNSLPQPSLKARPENPYRECRSRWQQGNAPDRRTAARSQPKARPEKPIPLMQKPMAKETLPADVQPQKKAADQTDDLLFPTEAELRAIKAAEKAAQTKERPARRGGSEPRWLSLKRGLRP